MPECESESNGRKMLSTMDNGSYLMSFFQILLTGYNGAKQSQKRLRQIRITGKDGNASTSILILLKAEGTER